MPRYKPPIGGINAYTLNGKTESQLNVATAEDASTLDTHDSTYFAESDGTPSNIFKIDSDGNGPLFKNVSGHLEIRTFDDTSNCDTTLGALTSSSVYANSYRNTSTDDYEIMLNTTDGSTQTSRAELIGTDSTVSGGGFIDITICGVDPVSFDEYGLYGRQSAQHKKSYAYFSSPYGAAKIETSSVENASLTLHDNTSSNELVAFPSYITINSNIVWHAGNDGAGSGLDADLLDSHDSSYFVPTATTINSHALTSNILLTGDDFDIPQIGSPTYNTLTEYINGVGFTGRISGGIISDGGSGTANVTSGSGLIRTTNSPYGVIKSFDWPTYTSVALTDNSINYICISYNGGTPNVFVTVNRSDITWTDIFPLGRVYRTGTTLNFVNSGIEISNFASRVHDRDLQVDGFKHVSGAVVSSPTGLKLATTLGSFYIGINPVSTPAKNTNASDTFTYWYRNGTGGWTTSTGNTSITPSLYDDGDGTLGTVSNNKYSIHLVYIMYDGSLHVQYGQSGSYTLSEAETATIPSPPPVLESFGILCAKIITAYNGTSPYAIQSSWDVAFAGSAPTNHAGLTNLDYANAGHTGFSPDTHSHVSFPTLNVGGSTDYASFATDGTIKLHGAATTWEDLRIEPVARTTGTNSPAFEKYFDNGSASRGVYLYSFDDAIESSEKEMFFTMQLPHSWAQTAIYLHVHWIPYAAGASQAVRWGLEYNWANVNSTYGNTTIIYVSTNTAGDTSLVQNKHYRSEFDSITPTSSQNGMSSILIGRLFRNSSNAADTFTNKAGLLYIDAHYEINDLGSSTISTK